MGNASNHVGKKSVRGGDYPFIARFGRDDMVVGEMTEHADVVVIGSGPGGYVAAIRAAQLGKMVTLIEKDPKGLGGICLHHGCIPSKSFIHTANLFWEATHAKEMGITFSAPLLDMEQTQLFKNNVVQKLTDGIAQLCQKAGVDIVYGHARFVSSNELHVIQEHDTVGFTADKIILATGARERTLSQIPFDGERIVSSTELLAMKRVPSSLAIIGSGYIAVEMAHTFQKFGSKVTMIHRSPTILTNLSSKVSELQTRILSEFGVTFKSGAEISSYKKSSKGVELTIRYKDGRSENENYDTVLVAVGRIPNTENGGLENTRVKLDEKGFVSVDETCQTTDPRILAIGDITGDPQLAHRAMYMGKIAAEVCAGFPSAYDATVCPAVMYADPEVAWVGLQEPEAIRGGRAIITGQFPFSANGRALGANQGRGFVQIMADPSSHVILGGLIMGANASDMISEISLAIEMGAKLEDVSGTIHPHPTYDEAILEACEDALGKCVHLPKKKK